jgi:glycosyltransferase involved in cell wall biosynthesis
MKLGSTLINPHLRSVHVIAGLDPAHGGPSYAVPRLCQALAAAGGEARLISVGEVGGCDIPPDDKGSRRFPPDWTGVPFVRELRCSSGLTRALRELAAKVDVVHDHGLWLMPNVEAGRAALRARKPFIVTPHGMLSSTALSFSRLKKRVVWALLQGDVVRRAACIHVSSEQEYNEVRDFGLQNPVAIIRSGIDIPELDNRSTTRTDAGRVVLSLGRIHPKKGLDRLVRAWAMVEVTHPNWCLRIVGPDELGHTGELVALAGELKTQRVSIEGPVVGDAKIAAYREADLFVLPTLNENFAITVAEALAVGTPVIATKGAPWHGLECEGCGWWIDHGVAPLVATLAEAMDMERGVLRAKGAKGRAWMKRDFSWDRVAHDMLNVYGWLSSGGEVPGTVRLK